MNGRRIYHARGKVLGGSSSINGMIFQRGNPLDYERWAADPGMETWDYAHCLPYFKRMETLPGRGPRGRVPRPRGAARPGARARHEPALRRVLRGRAAGGLPAHRRRERVPAGGVRSVRPQHPQRASAVGGPRVPAPGDEPPEPRRRRPGRSSRRSCSRATGPWAWSTRIGRGPVKRVRAGEVVLCGGAINSPQLLQLSGVGNADELHGPRDRRRARPARRRRAPAGSPGGLHPVRVQAAGLGGAVHEVALAAAGRVAVAVPAQAARAPRTTSRRAGSSRSNDDVAYPNLMFHFLPIAVRYDGSAPASDHGYQVHIGPMYSDARGSVKITSTDPGVHPALRFNYLSTDQDRREWVEAIRVARGHPEPAGVRPVQRRRALTGAERGDRRGDPGVGREGRRDRAAPLVHRHGWASTTCRWWTPTRCGCTGSRGCASWTPR